MSPENRSNDEIRADLAHVRSFSKATLLNAPAASMRLMRDVEPLLARIAAVEAELAALGTPTTEYRRQFKSSSAWHVSVNGPFTEPSNRLRDRVVDEYRIVGEWRAASPTPTGPETETK